MWPLAVWLFWGMGFTFHTVALDSDRDTAMRSARCSCWPAQPVLFISLHRRWCWYRSSSAWPPTPPQAVALATRASSSACCSLITLVLGRTYRDALSPGHRAQAADRAPGRAVEAREGGGRRSAPQRQRRPTRAKSQFFAAASHDLRQPLHAMGLFAEALAPEAARRARPIAEVTSLVNSINQSVDALEGLFGELLDHDAHRQRRRRCAVGTRCACKRSVLAPAPDTSSLWLSRKAWRCRFTVRTAWRTVTALLVERILRNLVSNAIRYTEDGGVLVACRPKR